MLLGGLVLCGLGVLELLLELRDRAVAQLGGAPEVALTRGDLELALGDGQLLAQVADALQLVLLGLPLGLHAGGTLAEVGELALQRLEALRGRLVVLLALQRGALDLELQDAALDLVDLLGDRVHLDVDARGRLVDQVDRLVRQEAVGDVAVRQRRGRDQRGVLDRDVVVALVVLAQAAQDRDRVLDARLADHHRLEAALERGVLLDVLAVLVERGRADSAQLAAGEHRLQQVGGVDGALGGARADDRVQLVDEEDDLALGLGDLLQDGLQAILELAAVLRAGDQGADVERHQAAVLERAGDVAGDDALREPLGDGGLADAGLADQDRVVLRAAAEHLDDAADLLVAADDRVELALLGALGEVDRVALERLEALLGVLVADAVRADGLDDGGAEGLRGGAALAQDARDRAVLLGQREQHVVHGDVGVPEVAHDGLRLLQRLHQFARRLRGLAAAAERRQRGELALGGRAGVLRVDAHLAQHAGSGGALLIEQRGEQVHGQRLRIAVLRGQRDGGLHGLLGLDGEAIGVH